MPLKIRKRFYDSILSRVVQDGREDDQDRDGEPHQDRDGEVATSCFRMRFPQALPKRIRKRKNRCKKQNVP